MPLPERRTPRRTPAHRQEGHVHVRALGRKPVSVTVRVPAKADVPGERLGADPRVPLRIDKRIPVLGDTADGGTHAAAVPLSHRRTVHTAQGPVPGATVLTHTAHRGGPYIREGAA
jgi:hypothetical protein